MLIIYKVRVKHDSLELFKALAEATLIPEAQKSAGCQIFDLYQSTADAHEFIFHESWDGEESVHAYKQSLIVALGEPHPGEEFPAQMNDMIEHDEDLV